MRARQNSVADARPAPAPAGHPRRRRGLTAQPWWPVAKRVLTIVFLAGVLALVANHARHVDWPSVLQALRAYPAHVLLAAAGLAAASHGLYSSYDLIGRHQTGHELPKRRVAGVAFVSYAFNLNLGALVGGLAVRLRLYARLGLEVDVISKIVALSVLTNWLGYLGVAGLVYLFAPIALPPDWKIGSEGLRFVGAALVLVAAGYLVLCARSRRREWRVRGHVLPLPSGRVAVLQIALSATNWSVIGALVWVLLRQQVEYPAVLVVLLVAAVAGVIAHVPAGLGVLEGVFIALLSHRVPEPELIAALLAYRGIYYLAPLALALPLYFLLDAGARDGKPVEPRSPRGTAGSANP